MGTPLNKRAMGRIINIRTEKVINALKENKKKHILEYAKAKEAYKLEGLEQVTKIKEKLADGKNGLRLNLIEPVDRVDQLDDYIAMFEAEIKQEIELETHEFNNYVLDKEGQRASLSNSTYFDKFGL